MPPRLSVLAALSLATVPALAAGEHGHDHAKGPNGGAVAEAGRYHLELVARGPAVEVFVTGEDAVAPVPSEGFKGTLILIVDGKPARVALAPAGANRLAGTAAAALPAKPKGAVQITGPDGATANGKFN
ncbi:hypothetical protein [uncultured Methylobacterium sp.]|jgi:hypothetical protein|uniref:hypothetical protein n=1 Tax=uncultured Methylobacterium sp. TaxID=157278 RepID=UPI0026265078|nr:hypothetical protein [uncultured Methylobacterium sp.]